MATRHSSSKLPIAKPVKDRKAAKRAPRGRTVAAPLESVVRKTATPAGMLTSKVTERLQTTLPPGVRQVLGLKGGERLGYVLEGDGVVRLINASSSSEHEDPVLQQFLALVSRHIASAPEGAAAFPPELLARARSVTAGIDVDHDAPIEGAISL